MAIKFDIELSALVFGTATMLVLAGCSSGSDNPSTSPRAQITPTHFKILTSDIGVPEIGETTISLVWDDIPDVKYKIYMASEPGVNKQGMRPDGLTPLTGFMSHNSVRNPFVHVNLKPCTKYYFSVVAVSTEGLESSLSSEVRAATAGGQFLAATNLSSKGTTYKQVDLQWLDNSCSETAYTIERATLSRNGNIGAWVELASLSKNSVIYTDTDVTPVTSYQYRVQAIRENEIAAFSNSLQIDVPQINSDRFLNSENNNATRFKESDITAQAYYKAIDPNDKKTTFADWKRINGFGLGANQSVDTPAIYFNNTDLGFGRRMFVINQADGGIASYVQNYPSLDDAINDNNLIATVAMEYTQPALDVVAAAKKQVLVGQSMGELTPTAILTKVLEPGSYKVVAARSFSDLNSLAAFTLSISYGDGSMIVEQGEWVSEWATLEPAYPVNYLDPANPIFSFDVPKPPITIPATPSAQEITIELASDIGEQIILLTSIGTVIAQNDDVNPAIGTKAQIVQNLKPGAYVVLPTVSNIYAGASAVMVTISGSSRIYGERSIDIASAGINDPNSPFYNNRFPFRVNNADTNTGTSTGTDTVTITMTANAGEVADPYLFLLDATSDGTSIDDVFRPLDYATQSIQRRGRAEVTLNLPAGTYTAVAAAIVQGQIDIRDVPFSMQLFDQNGTELAFDDPAVSQVWASIGDTNPYLPENPRLPFTITPAQGAQSQMVTVRLNVDPTLTTVQPMLYILGDIGQYRHIEAVDTGKVHVGPPVNEARIETVLNIGDYTLVAATTKTADTGAYQLDVSSLSTSLLSLGGNWTASSGSAVQGSGNPQAPFSVTQDNTPIVIRLQTSARTSATTMVKPVVYLLDSTAQVINQNTLPDSNTSVVDTQLLPGNYRLVAATKTSAGKAANFSLDVVIDGVAQPQINAAWLSSAQNNPYSPTNPRFPLVLTKNSRVTATLSSRLPTQLYILGEGEQKITTFYTFAADGRRLTQVDLDGRGAKAQPGVCVPCHGGRPKALLPNGVYPEQGNIGASFIAWDLDLFDYSASNSNYSRDAQEPILKKFNRTVLAHRLMPALGATENNEPARNTIIKGWYGGVDLPNDKFDGSFIPALWVPDNKTGLKNNIIAGADDLYLQVVRPTCRVCHLQQGGILFPKSSVTEKAIAFGSYTGFMSFQKEIEATIFDKSTMPLALRTFIKFWRTGQAELLAAQLPNFSHYKDAALQTEIAVPGRPIANAGASPLTGNRIVAINEKIILNGSASIFAESYAWRIVGKPDASTGAAILTQTTKAKAQFIADVVGDFSFELTVTNERGESTSSITLTADVATNVIPVSFANDIKPVLLGGLSGYQSGPLNHCMQCHVSHKNRAGVSFGGYYKVPAQINADFFADYSGTDVYEVIRGLVDTDQPHHSLFLQKPSHKLWHGGKTESGYRAWEPGKNKRNYELVLRWILEGAKNN